MNEREIRCPKGPATIFLIHSISYLFTILSSILMSVILDYPEKMPASGIFRIVLLGVTNLFMSIVLFSKKYNNTLIISSGILLATSISTLFFNITPYLITEIVFYLLLLAFTYIMVKMPGTPIREKAVKLRFIIPIFQFVIILISTIQTIFELYEKLTETMGPQLNDAVSNAIVLIPSLLGSIACFLSVLCYVWLANWLSDPYKKQKV